jgi:hypothetical protein
MAKDRATRQFWWQDKGFLDVCSARESRKFGRTDFEHTGQTPPYYFREAELFYRYPSCPYAFYHRAVKVKGMLLNY